ncbi:bifunctional NAD(P)H-hydrate repair enzyme [Terasakiella brassicae]|uniref:Bifunctional NAD(P)H-hydrate repair enzyme n=1 Tax=Terasakiella brassicae TaxID=1634917 RepID=A0A917BMI8_9PROT|nr:NAD(P)H-hydrate dehydratase [Terasakiella brassicae]GGF51896.1 bifunctional NAD(P)H-hydrate repair enzyme [Terasakiella brassicae]
MAKNTKNHLLSVAQMYEADQRTIESGISGIRLMEAAGSAIAREITTRWSPRKTVILCGPGNNGGDGFVVARLLHNKGWYVRILLLGERDNLKGDAKTNADRWPFETQPFSPDGIKDADLIVDAVFGAGLVRDVDGIVALTLKAAQQQNVPIIAVDMPSGVDGDSGQILGMAIQADITVTFCRAKTGHYLLPGRTLCGDVIVADIGIQDPIIEQIAPENTKNAPAHLFPWPKTEGHKFDRGHGVIVGGQQMTGATRLAALCARRVGAGLITIAARGTAYMVYRTCEPGNLVSNDNLNEILADPRKNTVLIGPGLGIGEGRKALVKDLLNTDKNLILDADALTMLAGHNWQNRAGETLLTPHEGEFKRLFPDITGSKLERARQAAHQSKATVLLKGPDTVIAAPDGRCTINTTGTPWLATAGSGDSLAGICLGLICQGLNSYDGACLGTWLHGKCAETGGVGLISEDISTLLPEVLKTLQK